MIGIVNYGVGNLLSVYNAIDFIGGNYLMYMKRGNAKSKLKRKNLDAIVLNSLQDKGAGFATNTNKVTFIDKAFFSFALASFALCPSWKS